MVDGAYESRPNEQGSVSQCLQVMACPAVLGEHWGFLCLPLTDH